MEKSHLSKKIYPKFGYFIPYLSKTLRIITPDVLRVDPLYEYDALLDTLGPARRDVLAVIGYPKNDVTI